MTTKPLPKDPLPPKTPPPTISAQETAPTAEQARPSESEFYTDQVLTIGGGHFVHDSFTAFLAPLLPLIQEKLLLGYTGAGGLAIFIQLPSLLTPFIGYLADRISLRYFVILAPAATATLMSVMGLAPSYAVLALLLLAVGVSTAAFHAPAPAMIARTAGTRVGTGMSLFMASGELGRTVGPLLAVSAVAWWGLEGIWRLAFVGWLTSLILYWRLHEVAARPQERRNSALSAMWPQARRVFPILMWIMFAKGFMSVTLTTYLPIYMSDVLDTSLWLAAASLAILEGAGVVGALATGTLSDRLGRARVLFVLLALAPLLMAIFLFGPSWLTVPVLIGLGLTAISPTPVLMAIVQDNFPDNRAVANGIFMFSNFLLRAVAILVIGKLADAYGLNTAFLWGGILAIFSIPAVFWLPKQLPIEQD